jgi:hypothetical protein
VSDNSVHDNVRRIVEGNSEGGWRFDEGLSLTTPGVCTGSNNRRVVTARRSRCCLPRNTSGGEGTDDVLF